MAIASWHVAHQPARGVASTVALLGCLGVTGLLLSTGTDVAATATDPIRQLVETPIIGMVRLSPDGAHVLYQVTQRSVARNLARTEVFLQTVAPDGEGPRQIAERERPRASSWDAGWAWCPDSRCLTYFAPTGSVAQAPAAVALMRYDLASRQLTPIPVRDVPASARGRRPAITTVGDDYVWSPSGRWMAFTAPLDVPSRTHPTVGVPITREMLYGRLDFSVTPQRGLFVLDVMTGAVEQVSPDTLDIREFAWAPDERQFAVTVPEPLGNTGRDLYLLDRTTHTPRPLVTTRGDEAQPTWAPDGSGIALLSAVGATDYGAKAVVVVSPTTRSIKRLTYADDPWPAGRFVWRPDSRRLYFTAEHQLNTPLVEADVVTGRLTVLATDGAHAAEGGASFSADCTRRAFLSNPLVAPNELFVQVFPGETPRQLTNIGHAYSYADDVRFERVSWKSQDNTFRVHGLLFTPRTAWVERGGQARLERPLPTVVSIEGGPGMVVASFPLVQVPLLLAQHGYAVLVPNTRGRVGYGERFYRAMYDGGYTRMPYADVMAGVDWLVAQGIADPARLSIIGHSYGGHLATYAVTRTGRFRAAVNYEGGSALRVSNAIIGAGGAAESQYIHSGAGRPFEPESQARLIAESPAFQLHCVTTPTLLLYGAHSSAEVPGRVLYAGLDHFGIPTEFIVYDEGHGVTLPTAMVDWLVRTRAWLDYWTRDLAYPDALKQRTYDSWRQRTGWPKTAEPCATKPANSY